jgi:hypothetical protein
VWTASSGNIASAVATFVTSSTGIRRIRSTRWPNSGAARLGAVSAAKARPAAALLPVRSLAQMPRERNSALSPKVDTVSAASSRRNRGSRNADIGQSWT